ncbi:DoxX family protein [Rufibacter hautae]|uniref:DoxX family protein n=1 Tax=Rufibacter hautae TaxID=2595005 RepID=A0A5B6TH13_9BACT|nr:DoxX family protein [Rufibacter hautae]
METLNNSGKIVEFTKNVEKWHHKHHVVLYDYGRIALGCFLVFKGISFLFNMTALEQILLDSKLYEMATFLAYTVVIIHIVGGAMITVGWQTRLALLLQFPIVLSALLFFTPKHDFFSLYSPFAVTIYTLLFLVFYLVGGAGYYSFDHSRAYRYRKSSR